MNFCAQFKIDIIAGVLGWLNPYSEKSVLGSWLLVMVGTVYLVMLKHKWWTFWTAHRFSRATRLKLDIFRQISNWGDYISMFWFWTTWANDMTCGQATVNVVRFLVLIFFTAFEKATKQPKEKQSSVNSANHKFRYTAPPWDCLWQVTPYLCIVAEVDIIYP